jgi:DNA-binding LytR/AlgR family response regulator
MKYLIIDDEPIAHRIIESYCAELSYLQKVGNAYNAFEASAIISREKVDLIFLDLNMPKMTGFEWLKTLSHPPKIIVTTAYKEHALEGYQLDVVDYLLKPFSFARFLKAVNKVSDAAKAPSPMLSGSHSAQQDTFFLKGDKKHHQVHTNELLYVEAFGNYSKVHLRQEMILTHEKISTLETLLPEESFLRVHKSFIVAKDKIRLIQGNMIHLEGHTIPVGQTYRSRIAKLLNRK